MSLACSWAGWAICARPARQLGGVADAAGSHGRAGLRSGKLTFRAAGVSPSEDGQGFGISADALCFDHLRGGGKCNAAMATWRRAISMLCWGAVS